jgi:hypothetical protein
MARKTARKRAVAKRPNGRPPKYDDSMPEKLVEFYLACAGNRSTDPSVPILKETFNRMPTFTGFAMSVCVTPRTLYNWAEKYEPFAEAMAHCNAIQDDMLQQFSLNGIWNPSMATFVLQAKHKWKKTDVVETNANIHLSFDSQDEDA